MRQRPGDGGKANEARGIGQRQWNDMVTERCSNVLYAAMGGVLVESAGVPELTPVASCGACRGGFPLVRATLHHHAPLPRVRI